MVKLMAEERTSVQREVFQTLLMLSALWLASLSVKIKEYVEGENRRMEVE